MYLNFPLPILLNLVPREKGRMGDMTIFMAKNNISDLERYCRFVFDIPQIQPVLFNSKRFRGDATLDTCFHDNDTILVSVGKCF